MKRSNLVPSLSLNPYIWTEDRLWAGRFRWCPLKLGIKCKPLSHAFPTPQPLLLLDDITQGGEEGPAVHTQRWLGMSIPPEDTRNFSHAGGASWNQVAGMRCPTGKTQPYKRNQRPEVRSLAGELGGWNSTSLLFVSLSNAWKLPPCFGLEHFGSDEKFVYSPADGSLRKSFRIFFECSA